MNDQCWSGYTMTGIYSAGVNRNKLGQLWKTIWCYLLKVKMYAPYGPTNPLLDTQTSYCVLRPAVQFSCSVVSYSLRPHEPQPDMPPYPSPTARIYPNPRPSSQWCHPTISPSVIPFSSCPQSFPASGSLQMSQLFALGGQSIGVSASISVLPKNTQDWSPLGWTGWISLQSKGLSRVFSNTTVQKHQYFCTQFFL